MLSAKLLMNKIAIAKHLRRLLASRYFFLLVIVFFAAQMVWIAFSGAYPMLFDEEYHLGIIEIYSRQISPFITMQPPEAAFHGDITRYASYFFHYLMSFPYRAISQFSTDLMTKVIIMRLICIALVVVGVWLFRKVLLNFGLSRAVVHAAILVFSLIPLVPFSFAQVNYDALLFVFLGLLLYFTQKASLKSSRQAWFICLFIITAGFAAITKFTVLPVVLGCLIFMGTVIYRQYQTNVFKVLLNQVRQMPRWRLVLTGLFLILSLGLVAERYGVNLATYKSIEPRCDAVRPPSECLAYTVYRRDQAWRQNFQAKSYRLMNPLEYSVSYWIPHIFNDFFVTGARVDQNKSGLSLRSLPTKLESNGGNPLLRLGAWAIFIAAAATIAAGAIRRKLAPQPFFWLFGIILIIYSVALWLKNYSDYLSIGTPVAAQGRYYVWLLIPILAMAALAFKAQFKNPKLYLGVFLISLLLLSQGGGTANYILYSNKGWYWPRYEQAIDQTNATARQFLRLFTPL